MSRPTEPSQIQVTFYTKAGCHLCEEARDMLDDIAAQTDFELTEIDIRSNPEIFEQYRYRIPVIIIDGETLLEGHIEYQDMARAFEYLRKNTMAIHQVKNRNSGLTFPVPRRKHTFIQFLQSVGSHFSTFLLNYWIHLLTFVLGLIVFTALSIPFLSYFGLDVIAKPLFYSLHFVCAQVPSHSFYIFGHQLGLCGRNFSIYSAMFVGSLIFLLSKKRLLGIPWWIWALMCLPMAVDGLTQLFGLRESSAELRILTGTLFGLGNVWFVLPFVQKTLLETSAPTYMYMPMRTMIAAPDTEADQQVTANPPSTPTAADTL